MGRTGYCILLGCLLTLTLNSSSFGQAAGFRTRDRQQNRTRGTTNRPSRSTGQFPAKNLPAEFAILNSRTIFSKDFRAARAEAPPRQPRSNGESRPSSPVFRGVINEVGGSRLAGIERGTSSITWYHEGQTLTNGDRVTLISLDQMIVTQRNGSRKSFAVGERLDAGTSVARDPSQTGPVTQPSDARFTLRDDSDDGE